MQINRPYKVGIFFDGGFYKLVVAHYLQNQHKGAILDPGALLEWCRSEVARRARAAPGLCRIVEARYVRVAEGGRRDGSGGRLEALLRNGGILVQEAPRDAGQRGLEVALSVEALDATLRLGLDAVVLIGGSTSYLPLARKLAAAGAGLMVLGFDISASDRKGGTRRLRTATALLDEAVWPVPMAGVIRDRAALFPGSPAAGSPAPAGAAPARSTSPTHSAATEEAPSGTLGGVVADVRERMGFLVEDWNKRRLFFHFSAVVDASLHDLRAGDRVEYERGLDPRERPCALKVRPVIGEDSTPSTSEGPAPEAEPTPEPEPEVAPDDAPTEAEPEPEVAPDDAPTDDAPDDAPAEAEPEPEVAPDDAPTEAEPEPEVAPDDAPTEAEPEPEVAPDDAPTDDAPDDAPTEAEPEPDVAPDDAPAEPDKG